MGASSTNATWSSDDCWVYVVKGRPIPQGRPRFRVFKRGKSFGIGKPYYSKTSTAYRKEVLEEIERVGRPDVPLGLVSVTLNIHGMRKNADPDNLAKQVLDALVTGGVIAGDNWLVVRRLLIDSNPAKLKEAHLEIVVHDWLA